MNTKVNSVPTAASEMCAYAEQVNLSLLNDLIAFVIKTAKATHAQKMELRQRCILLTGDGVDSAIQEKYGFLYLGELLERYEERFGLSLPDRRAIALALGYTKDIISSEMFVGNQQANFLQEVRRLADNDVYLTGAQYLLSEGQSGEQTLADTLRDMTYQRAEELIFALSLFSDFDSAFPAFRQRLLHLLGRGRSMPVLGNTRVLEWLIVRLMPVVKANRAKDMALFRAFCALRTSFVKEGSKPYGVLLEQGYTALEIAYANCMVVLHPSAGGALSPESVVTEKIVVELFRKALSCKDDLTPEVYAQLSLLFNRYKTFYIKCYGCHNLLETLWYGTQIRSAKTFIWFSYLTSVRHPVFSGFDLMDPAWDTLAGSMKPEAYLYLFEEGLSDGLSKEDVLRRIERYDILTGKSYLDQYRESNIPSKFSFLVKKGVIDLWDAFQSSLDENGAIICRQMLDCIGSYIRELSTLKAFRFLERFLPQYGFGGYKRCFRDFSDGLIEYSGYGNGLVTLKLKRDYLKDDEDGRRLLLRWVEEYTFRCRTEKYLPFICALLLDESAAGLLPREQQRALFDQIIGWDELSSTNARTLKNRYLTDEELRAEKASVDAAALAREKERALARLEETRAAYTKKVDGTLTSLLEFWDFYKYTSEENRSDAADLVYAGLREILQEKHYTLDRKDAVSLLTICQELIKRARMSFSEVQDYISQVKEAEENGTKCAG